MRRQSATVVVLALLLVSLLAPALPARAAPQITPRDLRAAGQEVGDTVTLFSTDGDEEGSFTVTDLTDEFEDLEDQIPAGERAVSLDVEIEADGGEVPVKPASFNIVDDNGFLWIDIDVTRTDDKESLEAAELADGDSVEGSLEIVVPAGVEIARLVYVVDNERILTLLDFTAGVEAGDEVEVLDREGEEIGTLVADEVVEEFDDLEPGTELPDGYVLYGVVVTAETTGDEPLTVTPQSFLAADENGTVYAAATRVVRTEESLDDVPDLDAGEVAEGDAVTGLLLFFVREEVAVDYVVYVPSPRFYPIVDTPPDGDEPRDDEDETPAADDDDETPAADDDEDDSPLGRTDRDETPTGDDETPEAGDDDAAPAGDCPGVAEWEDVAVANVTAWSDAFAGIDDQDLDPEELRDAAAEVAEVAEDQADSDPPAEAEALNALLVEAYEDSVDALEDLAVAVEEGDDELRLEAAGVIQEIGQSFQDGDVQEAIEELRDVCGAEVDQL